MRTKTEEFMYRFSGTYVTLSGEVVYIPHQEEDAVSVEYRTLDGGTSEEAADSFNTALPSPGYYPIGGGGVVYVNYPPIYRYKRGFVADMISTVVPSTRIGVNASVRAIFNPYESIIVPSRDTCVIDNVLYYLDLVVGAVSGTMVTLKPGIKKHTYHKILEALQNVGYSVTTEDGCV